MLVTIASFTEPWKAHMFCARLKVEGLAATVAHENHIWNDWPLSTALGGVKVQVPNSEADTARAVEQLCRNGGYRETLAEQFGDLEDLRCPHCGSHDLRTRHSGQQIVLSIASLFFAAIIPPQPSGYRCKRCGTCWKIGNASA